MTYKDFAGLIISEKTIAECDTFKDLISSIKIYSAKSFEYQNDENYMEI